MKSFPIFTFSAMVDRIILTTFRNNTLQKGNNHRVWLAGASEV